MQSLHNGRQGSYVFDGCRIYSNFGILGEKSTDMTLSVDDK